MTPIRRQLALTWFKVFDVLTLIFWFSAAAALVYYRKGGSSFENFLAMRVKVQNFAVFLGFLLAWHLSFSCFGLYRSRRLSRRWDEIPDLLKATTLGTFVIFLGGTLFNISFVTPEYLTWMWLGCSVIGISSRLVLRRFLRRLRRRGRNLRFMLIVGTNRRAIDIARKIEARPDLGYRITGFVDNDWKGLEQFKQTTYKLLTDYDQLPSFLADNIVDEVLIALPLKSSYQVASRILATCEEHGIIVRYISDIFKHRIPLAKPEDFEGVPIVSLHNGTMQGWSALSKRVLDVFLSVIFLVAFAPVLLITALLIKIDSPGPVFFIQNRVGLNKRRFRMYKFRTMTKDAERALQELEHKNEVSGPVFKIENDPRVTPVGKVLRRTSIDELPQLLNVLKGDMSLVGPRPLPERDYAGFDQDWHRRRFSVRPGITCLWQINGRNSVPFDKWMELDMKYIDDWSLWLDFKILATTIPAVLRRRGVM